MNKEPLEINLFREDYSEKKIVIINTHWNAEIIQPMVEDCLETLKEFKAKTHVLSVPGAFEIPYIVGKYLNYHGPYKWFVSAHIKSRHHIRGEFRLTEKRDREH